MGLAPCRWSGTWPSAAGSRWDNQCVEPEAKVERSDIVRLVGVYDADGSLRGELTYWVGARLGRRHCALCDITHGIVRERQDWRQCRDELGIDFDTVHRDEASADVMAVIGGALPAVVAVTPDGVTRLLGPEELARCQGSPASMVDAIREAAHRLGLGASWHRPAEP